MWRRVLDLLLATRTPLVFVDFKTTGRTMLPVEYAALIWAPWMPEELDELSVKARAAAPPGLWMASSSRLNPGRAIDPAEKRITAAEVKHAPKYNAPEQVAFWSALASGVDALEDPVGYEMPAIFAGHGIAETREHGIKDGACAMMRQWGYFAADRRHPPMIDTMGMQLRFAAADGMPSPPAPDAHGREGGPWQRPHAPGVFCPAVAHGLRPYAANLEGLTTALYGEPAPAGAGAMVDAVTSALCLWAMLELWAPCFRGTTVGEDPHAALASLLAVCNAPIAGAEKVAAAGAAC